MTRARPIGETAWTVGGYLAMQALRFAFNVALAALVAPKVFGVMALVNLFVQGLQMFSDLGLRPCVTRHPRGDDRDFVDTAWTVQVARGGGLWLASALLAWPAAAFYDEPALLWLVPLAGANALVIGFASAAQFTCARHIRRGPLVRREVGVYAVVVVVVLGVVWQVTRSDPSPAAQMGVIAGGSILAAVLEVALSYTLPGATRPRFRWDPDARGALLTFGGWIVLSTACTFLASQADRLVVGKLSLETLGVYHVAATIAALPVALVAALGTQIAFPLVSEAVRSDGAAGATFRRAHRGLVVLAGLLATGAVCVGPAVVGLVYDERYAASAGFLQLLGLAAWVTMLITPGELLLLAHDRPRALAVGQGVRLACLPAFLFGGYTWAGVPGLILGVAAGELVRYAVVAAFVRRAGERVFGFDLALTAAAAVVVTVYLVVEPRVLGGAPLVVRAAAGAAGLTAFWCGVYLAVVDPRASRRLAPVATWGRRAWTGARP